jgi:hypothetical protein
MFYINKLKIVIKSGFVPKAEKSFWQPAKRLVWLGTIIDTEYGYYKIPEDRVEKIINTITDISSCLSGSMPIPS